MITDKHARHMEKKEETRKQPINPKRIRKEWHIVLDFYCLPYYIIVDIK